MPIRLTLCPGQGIEREWESDRELRIGRWGDLEIVIAHPSISRFHALITPTEVRFCLIDQQSHNGSWIDELRLEPLVQYPIHVGDTLRFGRIRIRVTKLNDERANWQDSWENEHGHVVVRKSPADVADEANWANCLYTPWMIDQYINKKTIGRTVRFAGRKFRMFALACCRHLSSRLDNETLTLLDDFETQIDRIDPDLSLADERPVAPARQVLTSDIDGMIRPFTFPAVQPLTSNPDSAIRQLIVDPYPPRMAARAARYLGNQRVASHLFRDVFFNPSENAPTIDANCLTWNNRTVLKFAQTIYDDRRFELMPILADALQDATCVNSVLVEHCRQPDQHVRGCWALDQILGRE